MIVSLQPIPIYRKMKASNKINYAALDAYNPTLQVLIVFTHTHWDQFADLDLTVLTEYDKMTRESWTNGRYYLHGQLQVLPDTPITRQILNDANALHIQRQAEHSAEYTNDEIHAANHSVKLYQQLVDIIERYQFVYNDIMYNPINGIEYLRAIEHLQL